MASACTGVGIDVYVPLLLLSFYLAWTFAGAFGWFDFYIGVLWSRRSTREQGRRRVVTSFMIAAVVLLCANHHGLLYLTKKRGSDVNNVVAGRIVAWTSTEPARMFPCLVWCICGFSLLLCWSWWFSTELSRRKQTVMQKFVGVLTTFSIMFYCLMALRAVKLSLPVGYTEQGSCNGSGVVCGYRVAAPLSAKVATIVGCGVVAVVFIQWAKNRRTGVRKRNHWRGLLAGILLCVLVLGFWLATKANTSYSKVAADIVKVRGRECEHSFL